MYFTFIQSMYAYKPYLGSIFLVIRVRHPPLQKLFARIKRNYILKQSYSERVIMAIRVHLFTHSFIVTYLHGDSCYVRKYFERTSHKLLHALKALKVIEVI